MLLNMDYESVMKIRAPLNRMKEAIRRGRITVGFIGGSITDARVEYNWPEFVSRWLMDRFAGVRIQIENAAIGGTGSDLALFRAERDLIQRDCDLVFVEYAVNDAPVAEAIRRKSREGLIRKLLAETEADIVLVYTYMHEMYDAMARNAVPDSIADFEKLAEHYRLNSVWAGAYAFRQYKRGLLRYEQWLPDHLHPREFGSAIYAEAVTAFLEFQYQAEPCSSGGDRLPEPVDAGHWEAARLANLEEAEWQGPWYAYRSHSLVWADRIYAGMPGCSIRLPFEGTGVYLITNFGWRSADYRFGFDDGELAKSGQDYPDWCSEIGWMRAQLLAYPLNKGKHVLHLEVVPSTKSAPAGMRFDLIGIGIVP